MDNALLLYLKKLEAKIDNLDLDVDSVYTLANEIKIISSDILLGRQMSEWITDLKTFGADSDTYKNSERMNALIADTDAAKNPDIESYILQWAIANSKVGVYLNTIIGAVSGVNWSIITTLNQVFSDTKATDAVFGSEIAFANMLDTGGCGTAIIGNYTVTKSRIVSNPVSNKVMNARKKKSNIVNGANSSYWDEKNKFEILCVGLYC